jgi:hypothetical protein
MSFLNIFSLLIAALGEGLINLSANYYINNLLGQKTSYLSWKVTGRNITFMFVEAFGYFCVILLSEFSLLHNLVHFLENKASRSNASNLVLNYGFSLLNLDLHFHLC